MPILFALTAILAAGADSIDREAVVRRHTVTITELNRESPLQVGNGEFAMGLDITGLQTLVPFNTMSQWGWHSSFPPAGQTPSDFEGQIVETNGRPVRYPLFDPAHPELSTWMTANPHRINLGRLGFTLKRRDGTLATASDLTNIHQTVDLWTGIVTSDFTVDGDAVHVQTACHPTRDEVGVSVTSALVRQNRLSVFVDAPGNNPLQFANFVGDWASPATFQIQRETANQVELRRDFDEDDYGVSLRWEHGQLKSPGGVAPELTIHQAQYGAEGSWTDVTDKLRATVHHGRLAVTVNNQLADDPAPGRVKILRVRYESAGSTGEATAGENETLVLEPNADWRRFSVIPTGDSDSLHVACAFAPQRAPTEVDSADTVMESSRKGWQAYWKSGAAIDLSASTDPRWKELERRIVLSQYLMKVNEAGSLPPQESGLVNNGWFGRFHLEMVWWHAAHWALWNRWQPFEQAHALYASQLNNAKALAASQGYEGARWPKCIGPNGIEWPHPIHAFLMWQQPHPIFFAELDYRAHPTRETLAKWQPIVEATADFLANVAIREGDRYGLGPPLAVVSENTDMMATRNPAFELSYWRFGLRTAQMWRQRMGLPPSATWNQVSSQLAPLPVEDGVYVLYEGVPDMWTKMAFEHPALIGTYGMLPGDGVDRETVRRTLHQIETKWDMGHVWGWDFPMMAMCAARLGEREKAVDFLLTKAPGFQFDERGLATGGPFPYFPSNGGLLYAVGMMAGGWDGSKGPTPGFPTGWHVRAEGFRPAP